MSMNNCVQLIGHLVRDPEFRTKQDGERMATLTVVTKDVFRDERGEYVERPEYHRVVVFSMGAVKALEKYCQKASSISLRGKLQTRQWDDNGKTRYATEVVVSVAGEIIISDLDRKRVLGGAGGEVSQASADEALDAAAPF